jgi:hypothetical protein
LDTLPSSQSKDNKANPFRVEICFKAVANKTLPANFGTFCPASYKTKYPIIVQIPCGLFLSFGLLEEEQTNRQKQASGFVQ